MQSLISTRTVPELIEWLKGIVPLGMRIGSAGALKRYQYQEGEEKNCADCIRFCGKFGDCAAASDPPCLNDAQASAYTVRDAVLESLAIYIEEEAKVFVASLLLAHTCTQPGPPCQMPPRINQIMSVGEQNGDVVKAAIVSVLWSILPLQLDLRLEYNKESPQYYEPGGNVPKRKVILNQNAQPHWEKLRTFKGPTRGDAEFDPSEQLAWANGKAISMSSVIRKFRAERCPFSIDCIILTIYICEFTEMYADQMVECLAGLISDLPMQFWLLREAQESEDRRYR